MAFRTWSTELTFTIWKFVWRMTNNADPESQLSKQIFPPELRIRKGFEDIFEKIFVILNKNICCHPLLELL